MNADRTVNPDILDAFNDCVNRLAAGESVDECLRLYPALAATLRDMLVTTAEVRSARIDASEIMAAKERIRFRLEGYQAQRRRRAPVALPRFAAAAALILALTVGGLGFASDSALPGDLLYGAKQAVENARLALAGNDPALSAQFAQRRRDEVARLLVTGREADVYFEGNVIATNGENWLVESIPVTVTAAVSSGAASGDYVGVSARTRAGVATAVQITVLRPTQPGRPTPTPSITVTVTEPATATPSTTPTLMPSLTPTITPNATETANAEDIMARARQTAAAGQTQTALASITPSPTGTFTPSPTATLTSTPLPSATPTWTLTYTPSATLTLTSTPTATLTSTPTATTVRPRPTRRPTSSNSGSGGGGSGSGGSGSGGGDDDGGDDDGGGDDGGDD
jgi:uncharacterized membrane protein YgcG